GRVVPLDDVITDEMHDDIEQSVWVQGMADGKTYMMPYYMLQNTLCYNKELFRQAGLEKYLTDEEKIQSWTLEEWEEILKTLREELPASVYPMMMYAKNNQGDTHIMTLLRSHGSRFFDENHNFNLETKEGIAALQWIKDCYDAGYYPIGAENLEISETTLLRENGQLVISHINNTKANPDLGLVNYPSIDGKGYATCFISGFEVFDNGDERKVQVAKDFLSFFYSQEDLMDVSTCGLPVSNAVFERHGDDIYMLKAYQDNTVNVVDFMENNPNWLGVRDRFYTHIYDLLTGKRTPEEVAADLDEDCNAAIEEGRSNSKLHS
ncbi:MAG: extracellular solute-binding protein, partial [Bacillota bacterium]|nr:extracellular solute-binding protein [Bacillota bacterium]